jgi:N-acetylglutamate synthase-like GNAT family acetyltransferase
MPSDIQIRSMTERDIPEADRIMRLAFGTFLGLPDPMLFMGDADYVRTRFHTDPSASLVAEADGKVIGSNFALHWGSVGIFGPLTTHPDFWDKGVAKQLVQKTMDIFEKWHVKHAGLFTFAQSNKHIHLYQKFGFWPRFLTAVMSKPITTESLAMERQGSWTMYSKLNAMEKDKAIEECKSLTNKIYDGLDLRKEIYSVEKQHLGDTILQYDKDDRLIGLAVCHCGPSTEAGSGICYMKFGAVTPENNSQLHFDQLLNTCESFGKSQGLSHIVAGVNTGRHNAYKRMIECKFRTSIQGVAMHKPNEPGYNRDDVYLIDDWR